MSSLAASRADGYYHPPDYDPEKHGSLNQFRGQHPLRERAKKLDQGILVIRFEMPFNCWCNKCQHLIGKGVRFNAEKKQIGMYYSTRIWSFSMRCPSCSNGIEVVTDPKNTEYVVKTGGRRKVETYTAEDAETLELPDKEEQQMAAPLDDAFTKLERGESDKKKGRDLNARVAELYHDSNLKFKNDYQMNKLLRSNNRKQKKEEKARDVRRAALGLSADVTLLPESEADALEASAVQFNTSDAFDRKWREKRQAIMSQSIFAPEVLTSNLPPGPQSRPTPQPRPSREEGRASKRPKLEPIPEGSSIVEEGADDGDRWQMDPNPQALEGGGLPRAGRSPGVGVASDAWKRSQLTAKPQREARKDLSRPLGGVKSKKKKSVMDMAKEALRRR